MGCLLLLFTSPLLHDRLYSGEIPIGVEQGHIYPFRQYLPVDHELSVANDYWYGYMRACGIDYDRTPLYPLKRSVNSDVSKRNHLEIISRNDLSLMLFPGRYSITQNSDTLEQSFNPGLAWKAESREWTPIWDDHFFQDKAGNSQKDFTIDDTLAGWRNGELKNGFIIGKSRPFDFSTDPEKSAVKISRYRAFFHKTGDYCKLTFRLKKLTEKHPDSEALCTFHVMDLIGGHQSFEISSDDLVNLDVHGWGEVSTDYMFISRDSRFALQWNGGDDLAVSHVKYTSRRFELMHNNAQFSKLYRDAFIRQFNMEKKLTEESNCNLLGWCNLEPWIDSWDGADRLNRLIRSKVPGEFLLVSTEAGYGKNLVEKYFTTTESDAILFDIYPVTWQTSASSLPAPDSLSIQQAWEDNLLMLKGKKGIMEGSGLRAVAEASRESGKPFWMGIQSSGQLRGVRDNLKNKTWRWELNWFGEPTPEMVKCLGWFGIAYGAKGFFYHYWSPIYGFRRDAGLTIKDPKDWYSENKVIGNRMSGAVASGLMQLYPDYYDKDKILIENQEHLEIICKSNSSAWLGPSPRWYAAQRFNSMIDSLENCLSNLFWLDAGTVKPLETEVKFVEITGARSPYTDENDKKIWVEIGIHQAGIISSKPGLVKKLPFHAVSIVNRRCMPGEARRIESNINWLSGASLAVDMITSELYPAIGCELIINPAEGKILVEAELPKVTNAAHTVWQKSSPRTPHQPPIYINRTITISPESTLDIQPGTCVLFGPHGALDVRGKLNAIGTSGNPITFLSYSKPRGGSITVENDEDGRFEYCDFFQLKRAPQSSGGSLDLINCQLIDTE